MALYNLVLSSWAVFNKKSFPLKVYIADERKYYNLEDTADLGAIAAEATDLVSRIHRLGAFSRAEGPGGLMLRVARGA